MYAQEDLLDEIEQLRIEMSKIALQKGPDHHETLEISQKLDQLLNKYDRACNDYLNKS